MVRIGFLLNYPTSYKGAINYFRNLFFAIDKYLKNEVTVYLFVPDNLSQEYIDLFSPYVKIVKTNILRRRSTTWLFDKIIEKSLSINPLLDNLLLNYQIDVVSHSSFISKKVKTINWIMDFQHVHFPELWTKKELDATISFLHRLIIKSDKIFLSSHAAFEDFKSEYPELINKVNVLHFVCQPQGEVKVELNETDKNELLIKYNIDRPFFYLPNQFWSHKNHETVFKAVKKLKDEGHNPLLITSGLMNDFRKKNNHVENLQQYIKENNLGSNVLFLGLIPYTDVLNLIILSDCIINPSFFEGWSSTVEEAKTMGKRLFLSNIKVHQEQDPPYGVYFDPNDIDELAGIMEKIMLGKLSLGDCDVHNLRRNLMQRTEKFALDYLRGVKEVLQIG